MNVLQKLYYNPPQIWVSAVRARLRRMFRPGAAAPSQEQGARAVHPQTGAPLADLLDEEYFARRDPLIQSLIERIRRGEPFADVMQGFDAREFDERVAEYAFLTQWLLEREKGLELLDVGCVVNNRLVTNLLLERCGQVWLCNPALEPRITVPNPLFYHVADLADSFPGGERFPMVTCLSTIEHIGYDNSQYGIRTEGLFTEPQTATLISAMSKLATLTAPGGHLLVSVPFGHREALIHPVTNKVASQVFDHESLAEGLDALRQKGVSYDVHVLEARPEGWLQVSPEECHVRYAESSPAAAAVALIAGHRANG